MPTINGGACVVNDKPVDKVYSNGVQVYGRNLLKNTSDFSSNWSSWPETYSVSKDIKYNEYPSIMFIPTSRPVNLAMQIIMGTLNQSQYVASFWAKADNAGDRAYTELFGSQGAKDFVLTTNWVCYTAILTSTQNDTTCYFGVPFGNKGNVYIALPKLEKGTTTTPWTPAPEDIGIAV